MKWENKTYKCLFCGQRKMVIKKIYYEFAPATGERVIIPDIEMDICDTCGEKVFVYEAAVKLKEAKKI